jgi:hypothetical protein
MSDEFHGVDEPCDRADPIIEPAGTQVHLCNYVAELLIPEKKLLHTMWEDNDLEGNENAMEHYRWLEESAPGQFALIDTGDYIVPECLHNSSYDRLHEHCETYDATYSLYLVPINAWNKCKDAVLAVDKQWREEHNRCQRKAA